HRFLRGMVNWLGFRTAVVPFKPARQGPALTVLDERFDPPTRQVRLRGLLRHTGKTPWLPFRGPGATGGVTITLPPGERGRPGFREAESRNPLAEGLPAGEERVVEVNFRLPDDWGGRPWHLDLIKEGVAWLSTQGIVAVEVGLEGNERR